MPVKDNPAYKEIANGPRGFTDFDGGNETRTRSKYDDPAKHRVGGPAGGVYSCDLVIGDPTNPDADAKELGFFGVQWSDFARAASQHGAIDSTGMFKIVIRDDAIPARADGNEDPKELVMLQAFVRTPDGQPLIQLHERWNVALAQLVQRLLGSGFSSAAGMPAFMAAGNCRLHVQEDLNVVVYNTNGSDDPNQWTAVFDSVSLLARLAAVEARYDKIAAALAKHGIALD